MGKVKIITDSCSDLPAEIIDEYNIGFLNIEVNIDNKTYYDRFDLNPEAFYQIISQKKEIPKTSRITPAKFKEAYQQALKDYDQLLVIVFSSNLSGILESAVMAKKEVSNSKITVIDTKAASVGQGLLVYQAAKMLKKGRSITETAASVMEAAAKLEHIIAVGDLEMLKRGGRISKTKSLMANVLNIKPILHIEDGKILAYDKIRGKKRMLNYLIKQIEEKADQPQKQVLAVTYSQNKEEALKLKAEIEKKFAPKEVLISEIGAAVGSHIGPGTLAVVYQNSKKVAEPKLY